MHSEYDVIIIGAGPAGSSAAIMLARAGWSVALLEKQRFPRRKVCGECLAASNLPLLDELGVGQAFAELAGPQLRKVALMHADQTICAALPRAEDARHPWGRALGREWLDTLLLQRAIQAGATVLQPWMAQEIGGEPGNFRCAALALDTRQTALLTAPLLIAAQGSWDPVLAQEPTLSADLSQARTARHDGDLFAFKANFAAARLEDELLPVLALPGGYGGMVVGDHGIATLACCIRRDRLNDARQRSRGKSAGEAVETYLNANCAGVREALAGAQRQGKWLSIGPIRPGIHMPRDGGRMFLVGNAAGEAHPIIGEGMSMALQSAWLLCRHLIEEPRAVKDAGVQDAVKRRYARAWHGHFAQRIRLAAAFAHVAMRPALCAALLPLLRNWPSAMTHAASWSGKTRRPAGRLSGPGPALRMTDGGADLL